jgi:hypothetical protein
MVKIMEQRKSGPCELEPVTESRDDAPEPLGWNCPYSSAHEERVSYIKIDALGLCFKSRPEERLRSPSSTFPGSALRGDSYSGMGAGTLCLGLFWERSDSPILQGGGERFLPRAVWHSIIIILSLNWQDTVSLSYANVHGALESSGGNQLDSWPGACQPVSVDS